MIEEGEPAPTFELPAVVDGAIRSVALEDYLGANVVVLAFYPADFNPAGDEGTTDLDELDLFTMQKDVSVLGISADSVYSHRAFADAYDLNVPLLSDTRAAVAGDYGVAVDDESAGYRTERAVFVVGPDGTVEFAWSTDDLGALPPVDPIRSAIDDVGGASMAEARYGVGHAHYVEGRRAFTSAMRGFEADEWMMAQGDFRRAYDEFEAATDQFNTAARFSDDEESTRYFELAEDKAEMLWQAAEWLAESASAYASGEGTEGQSLRDDAERTLEDAKDIAEPVEPEEFPPDDDPADAGTTTESILPDDEEEIDASLDVDVDGRDVRADTDLTAEVDAQVAASQEDAGESPEGDEIDEAELEEITAELEEQTEAARAAEAAAAVDDEEEELDDQVGSAEADAEAIDAGGPDASADAGELAGPVRSASADDEGDAADRPDESAEAADDEGSDPVELDLSDPTGGEGLEPLEEPEEDEAGDGEDDDAEADEDGDDEVTDDDLSGGDHGVPDSL